MAATSTAALWVSASTVPPPVVAQTEPERPKLTLRSTTLYPVEGVQQQLVYVFEVSPNEVNLQRLALNYGELERPGRKPLLQARSEQLQQVSATVLIVSRGNDRFFSSCQAQIDGLVALARLDTNVVVSYPGIPATMVWRVSDLSVRTVRRNGLNEVTIAEAEITLTESVAPVAVVPGMPVIKDVPASRSSTPSGTPTGDPGSTQCQRYSGTDQAIRDADTACRVETVLAAGTPYG